MMTDEEYKHLGMSVVLLGMKFFKDQTDAIYNDHVAATEAAKPSMNGKIAHKRGRPLKAIAAAIEEAEWELIADKRAEFARKSKASKDQLARLTPKQRYAEAARRRAVAQGKDVSAKTTNYWAKMTPEERAAEGQRRRRVGLGEEPSRDARQWVRKQRDAKVAAKPGHSEAARKKIGELRRNSWSGLTKKQWAQKVRNAAAGRAAAAALRSQQQGEARA